MDIYIVNQLSIFFLFSVGLLSSLGVAIGTVSDLADKITEYQLPVSIAILIFGYKLPEYIAYALPISVLLTSLIIYGRLSSDRELVALVSFGISFYRIITPALVFSLIVTGLTFLFNELIVPTANYQANLIQTPFIEQTELNLQKKDIFYPEYELKAVDSFSSPRKLKKIYFAEQYYDQTLQGITVIYLVEDQITQIVTAKSARWDRKQEVWDLSEGKISQINHSIEDIITKNFINLQLPLSATIFEIARKKRNPEDMNIRQAKEYLNIIKDSGKKIDIVKFALRIQQKYAFPFICLIFALIGSTLGAKYSYINRSKGFGFCVAIVFVYYVLGFTSDSLGITGVLSPFLAAWLPNILCLIIGIWLLVTVNN
ncbi:MAG: LptF/LptG family permease [Pleurocapsa sp. MO_192.B19]|nr:LptF/LptG family permease [Pleurocapsa sp. MO_192.B19]